MKRWFMLFACIALGVMLFLGCGDSGSDDDDDNNILDPNGGGNGTSGYVVSGRIVDEDGNGLAGIDVGIANEDYQDITSTDSSGNYSLTGVPDGYYGLTPFETGYSFDPEYLAITVSGGNVTGRNFVGSTDDGGGGGGEETITVTIGEGMTPQISWTGGNVNTIIVMDTSSWGSDYQWEITTPAGQYNAISSPVTYGTAPEGAVQEVYEPLEADSEYRVTISRWTENGSVIGYGYFDTIGEGGGGDGYEVTGAVVNSSRRGIEGVTVVLASTTDAAFVKTATTDSGGSYTFYGIPDGTYIITPAHSDYIFTPITQEVTVDGANEAVSNFRED